MKSAINWFELPVADMDRAVGFYEALLGARLSRLEMGGAEIALLPHEDGVGGALVRNQGYEPTDGGPVVYLSCGDDLSPALGRVEPGGGEVLLPKTSVGDHGFCAWFRDSEGNRVGLHSRA